MAEDRPTRVGVYIDFDNVVISRYDALHGRNAWRNDDARDRAPSTGGRGEGKAGEVERRLAEATVDVGALLDYAASFGTVALARSYADWSVPANAAYRRQLVDRAVDLVQLFALGGTKNGADIRLSVDVIEDLSRYADLTHVVLVAGDSDYVALAQRCKQLGRYVVGIGVAGSTGRALIAACDEFSDYDALPDVKPAPAPRRAPATGPAGATPSGEAAETSDDISDDISGDTSGDAPGDAAGDRKEPDPKQAANDARSAAGSLLVRAVRIVAEKADDDGWAHLSTVKQQMVRMDPGFKEKSLGFSSFRAFVESYRRIELEQSAQVVRVRFKG